ncbi:hypothetical protein QTP86_018264 [Hemibagrus guttatus]|nr:hypothetical protein QTP86_018264 [Hemibagrus guttatus]
MDKGKVAAVRDWPVPTTINELQRFLGFANFYRRFIRGYSSLTSPLTNLLRNNPQVANLEPSLDASTTRVAAVLSQQQGSPRTLHPCAFFSRKLSPAEVNYDIGNRKLLAIKLTLEEWRHWLKGAKHPFVVLTDHKNLEYLRAAKRLNPRQARWALFFTRFQFTISYCPGPKNVKADALSRLHGWEEPSDEPEPILPEKLFASPISWSEETLPEPSTPTNAPPGCPPGLRFIPRAQRSELIHSTHTSLGTGHPGIHGTLSLLKQRFWWPGMASDVRSLPCSHGMGNPQMCQGRGLLVPREREGLGLSTPAAPKSTPQARDDSGPTTSQGTRIPTRAEGLAVDPRYQDAPALQKAESQSLARPRSPPPPLIMDEGSAYLVRDILDSRRRGGHLEYLVDWEGYGPEEQSWVLRNDVLDPALLEDFHARNPNRPASRGKGRPPRQLSASPSHAAPPAHTPGSLSRSADSSLRFPATFPDPDQLQRPRVQELTPVCTHRSPRSILSPGCINKAPVKAHLSLRPSLIITGRTNCVTVQQSSSILVNEAENITITCRHDDNNLDQMYWYQQNSHTVMALIGYTYTAASEPKYEDKFNKRFEQSRESTFVGRLTISDLRQSDSAVYYCAASKHSAVYSHNSLTKTSHTERSLPVYFCTVLSLYPGVPATPSLPISSLTPSSFLPQIPASVFTHAATAQATLSSQFLFNTGPNHLSQQGMSSPDPLHELVEALRRTLTSVPASTAPVSSSASAMSSPSPPVIASSMAAPAPYSGSAEDCNGFLLQCSLALEMQLHLYPADHAKVAFIISHLDRKALRWAEPLWTQNNPNVSSFSIFIEHFKEVFGKAEWDSSLGERLCRLRQGAMSVSDYALQFRTLTAASGWSKQALITTYRQGLDPRVRMHLVAYEDSIGLERFIQLSIRFATRM